MPIRIHRSSGYRMLYLRIFADDRVDWSALLQQQRQPLRQTHRCARYKAGADSHMN
eukprot:COSAG06_NODE_288_length_18224_cov_8.849948_29_plen_56_part_00